MKVCLLALALGFTALSAQAGNFRYAKCTLTSAPKGAPDWQANAFILEKTAQGFEGSNDTSGRSFDLTVIDPSELPGYPVYEGGTYYKGGNDLWVLITKNLAPNAVIKVVKPLETDINTNERPASYDCFKTM